MNVTGFIFSARREAVRLSYKMVFEKRPTRAGFQILLKLESFVFVVKNYMCYQFDWTAQFSRRYIPLGVSL